MCHAGWRSGWRDSGRGKSCGCVCGGKRRSRAWWFGWVRCGRRCLLWGDGWGWGEGEEDSGGDVEGDYGCGYGGEAVKEADSRPFLRQGKQSTADSLEFMTGQSRFGLVDWR